MGGPGRVVRIGSGARALPGAGARQRGPRQGRQNRGPSERGRQEGQLRAALRVSKAGNAASPAADEDKAPDSQPLRPQPRGPLRSVTRTVRAGSGFHWWPGSRQAPPTAPGSPAPFRARVSGARAASWPCRGGAASWAPAGGDAGGRSCLFVSALAIRWAAGMGPRQRPASAKGHPAR